MYSDKIGGVSWIDLTVKDAGKVKDFYSSVVGFEVEACSMGEYDDFVMKSPKDESAQLGICHAKGPNSDIPPQWMVYFNVSDVEAAVKQTVQLGGQLVRGKTDMGSYYMCIIKDPAGAMAALVSTKECIVNTYHLESKSA